jgi:hypothetical protein
MLPCAFLRCIFVYINGAISMQMINVALPMLVATFFLLGCEKHPVETTNPSPSTGASSPAPASVGSAPTADPSLPPLQPATAAPKTGTDATSGSTLTRTERDSKMPLPGQVNDHSTPDAAKQGDSTAPVKATK